MRTSVVAALQQQLHERRVVVLGSAVAPRSTRANGSAPVASKQSDSAAATPLFSRLAASTSAPTQALGVGVDVGSHGRAQNSSIVSALSDMAAGAVRCQLLVDERHRGVRPPRRAATTTSASSGSVRQQQLDLGLLALGHCMQRRISRHEAALAQQHGARVSTYDTRLTSVSTCFKVLRDARGAARRVACGRFDEWMLCGGPGMRSCPRRQRVFTLLTVQSQFVSWWAAANVRIVLPVVDLVVVW